MTESNAWVLLVPTGCWLASRAAEWAVGQCVGYRYWGPRGALFSNLGVPAAACIVAAALLAVFPPTLSRAKRTVVQWIVVVGLIASTHWAAARLRWVEGYYVLPRGTDVRSMSPGALVAAWLDSANVELRGSAKMELEERGASVADAVAERVERWKRAKGAKYLQEG